MCVSYTNTNYISGSSWVLDKSEEEAPATDNSLQKKFYHNEHSPFLPHTDTYFNPLTVCAVCFNYKCGRNLLAWSNEVGKLM